MLDFKQRLKQEKARLIKINHSMQKEKPTTLSTTYMDKYSALTICQRREFEKIFQYELEYCEWDIHATNELVDMFLESKGC